MRLRKIPSSFETADLDGELVLIDCATGKFFALKDVGLRIWELLDSEPELGRICDELLAQYDVDRDTCRDSVDAFAGQLIKAGFAEYY